MTMTCGDVRESNSGPLAPEARIIPLDQHPTPHAMPIRWSLPSAADPEVQLATSFFAFVPKGARRVPYNAKKSAWCPVRVREWPTLTLKSVTAPGRTRACWCSVWHGGSATGDSLRPHTRSESAERIKGGARTGECFSIRGWVVPTDRRAHVSVDTWARTLAFMRRRFWPGTRRSHLDGRINTVRCPGVEPGSLAWEANILTVGPTTPRTPPPHTTTRSALSSFVTCGRSRRRRTLGFGVWCGGGWRAARLDQTVRARPL